MKSGFVALIGKPNTGKSTLFNCLSNTKEGIVTHKPGTTINILQKRIDKNESSFVLTDTPGLTKSNYSDKIVNKHIINGYSVSDIILYVVDRPYSPLDTYFLQMFKSEPKITFLVINKIDLLEDKTSIDKIILSYRPYFEFNEVVPISSLNKTNIDKLDELLNNYFDNESNPYVESYNTKADLSEIVVSSIWQYCLIFLNEEIPYKIKIEIVHNQVIEGIRHLLVVIKCRSLSHKKIIIGNNASIIKQIRVNSQNRIKMLSHEKLVLDLKVKCTE
jgi:GTP-binding protein Era